MNKPAKSYPANRLTRLFSSREPGSKVLSLYITAGYPKLSHTQPLIEALAESGVDFIELGVPFSDPIADGPTIQLANEKALSNGVTLDWVFEQVEEVRKRVDVPIVLMGHVNPILQFGVTEYCKRCQSVGVDGSIVPDLPLVEYRTRHQPIFAEYDQSVIFLTTSETSPERVVELDQASSGFLYVVSSPSVTGNSLLVDEGRELYFKRLSEQGLTNPLIVGFGVDGRETFERVTRETDGAIIASAYLRELEASVSGCSEESEVLPMLIETTRRFVSQVKGE